MDLNGLSLHMMYYCNSINCRCYGFDSFSDQYLLHDVSLMIVTAGHIQFNSIILNAEFSSMIRS